MILGSVFFLHLYEKSYLFYFFVLACCLSVYDVVLVANETVDSILGSGNPGVVCKLDIEKADDHVN